MKVKVKRAKTPKFRTFSQGREKFNERDEYDHVGIKNCLYNNFLPRTEDLISRGRRAFNAVASIDIKRKGVCMNVFWAIIMPIVTYGSELWVMHQGKTELLRKSQRYTGRRCQKFPKKSPNYSSYYSLGWISIDRFIKVKKLLFLRSIIIMPHDAICKQILVARAAHCNNDVQKRTRIEHSSPIFKILNVCNEFDILEMFLAMIENGSHMSKIEWKEFM